LWVVWVVGAALCVATVLFLRAPRAQPKATVPPVWYDWERLFAHAFNAINS
jgi:hypothetical protein